MARYFRPIVRPAGHPAARPLGSSGLAFAEVAVHRRGAATEILPTDAALALYPEAAPALAAAARPRPPWAGTSMDRPAIMGVVNVTPDSFSDGGLLDGPEAAVAHALALAGAGADILDIGGESTRPGAQPVSPGEESDRVLPVIEGIVAAGCAVPVSIDTRNAPVARAALAAGARIVNDVSALSHDPGSAAAASAAAGVCLMHAQGDPRTMQDAPRYDDVLLDVFDFLAERLRIAALAGIAGGALCIDPGIGFGKTLEHNVTLLRGLSLLQTLGVPVLLGVSRKGFIGRLGGEPVAALRAPGSIVAGLAGLDQGVQILRVHDVAETVQAVRVWRAIREDAR